MSSSNLEIRVNIRKIIEFSKPLQKTIDNKTLIKMIYAFSSYLSELYLDLIDEAINSNRYKGKWEPTDDKEYREYIGTTPKADIIDLMAEAIEVKKIGYYYVIRFNPRYKYPESKLPLIKVIRAIDGGTAKFHARPIFKKILRDIDSNIFKLWKGYLLRKGV